MVDYPEGLTTRQENAVAALITEPTITRAAERCGISERTLHRWLEEPAFASAYRRARREAFGHAISVAQRVAPMAVATQVKVMTDSSAPAASKVAAAAHVLRFAREAIELDDLAERIELLEERAKAVESTSKQGGWGLPRGDRESSGGAA